jgi:hypothetical protein
MSHQMVSFFGRRSGMPKNKGTEYKPLENHIGSCATKGERLDELIKYFNTMLLEDGREGTSFDFAVTNALEKLKREYREPLKFET